MNKLQLYILKRFFFIFFMSMIFLQGVFIIVRTMEMIDIFLAAGPYLTFEKLVLYYVYEMPFTLNYLFPIATFFSIVLCLGKMSSDGELIILHNSGRSIFYYIWPIIVFIAITCTVFMIKDYEIYYRPHQIHMEIHRNLSGQDFFAHEVSAESGIVQFGSDNKIYIASTFDPKEKVLHKTKIIFLDKDNTITNISFLERAYYLSDYYWQATNVSHREFIERGEIFITTNSTKAEEKVLLGDDPKIFKPNPHLPVHLSKSQVLEEVNKIRITGGNIAKWETEYHLKIALPYIALVMLFLGITLSTYSRRSVLVISFVSVLAISVAYMVLLNVGGALGYNGTLPPILAGWFGNIIFSVIAFILYQKLQN